MLTEAQITKIVENIRLKKILKNFEDFHTEIITQTVRRYNSLLIGALPQPVQAMLENPEKGVEPKIAVMIAEAITKYLVGKSDNVFLDKEADKQIAVAFSQELQTAISLGENL